MAGGMIQRLLQAPKQPFFLFGPRGTGKTRWLGERLANGGADSWTTDDRIEVKSPAAFAAMLETGL
jgi:hypothetical protein